MKNIVNSILPEELEGNAFLHELSTCTLTENGAETFNTSDSHVLDFFATIGGQRYGNPARYTAQFDAAYAEDKRLATKCLFYTRDSRGGLGERKIFRDILKHLAVTAPETVIKNLPLVAEYGRWDDLLPLLDTQLKDDVLAVINRQLTQDIMNAMQSKPISLLAKWLPSENASNADTKRYARLIAAGLNMTPRHYRKVLADLRADIKIIETKLTKKEYDFDYSAVPSRAMLKYKAAFRRNDYDRFDEYMTAVSEGKEKMNTAALEPYDIVHKFASGWSYNRLSSQEEQDLDTIWRSLPDYTTGENAMVMLDGSGSMYGTPHEVGTSLAIYFAERNNGPFKGYFMTFSHRPQLVKIEGNTIGDKIRHVAKYDECSNTNISAAFELLLNTARRSRACAEDMPKKLYIISDMEFDYCVNGMTNFEHWQNEFAKAGFDLPQIVFWNVHSMHDNLPVRSTENNTILVSGSSASTFKMVMTGDVNPYNYMLSVLNSERYAPIHA